MDNIVYNALIKYFSTLENLGYIKDKDVNKVIFLCLIEEFIYNDFRGCINEQDYRDIERALYKIFGTSCLVPYPNFCSSNGMNNLHLGDISELSHRVQKTEEEIKNIKDTKVVKVALNYKAV